MKITAIVNKFKNKVLQYYSNTKIDSGGLDILYYTSASDSSYSIGLPTNIQSKFDNLEDISKSNNTCLVIVSKHYAANGKYNLYLNLSNTYFRNEGKTIYLVLSKMDRSGYYTRVQWNNNSNFENIVSGRLYKFEYYKAVVRNTKLGGDPMGLLTDLVTNQTIEIKGSGF